MWQHQDLKAWPLVEAESERNTAPWAWAVGVDVAVGTGRFRTGVGVILAPEGVFEMGLCDCTVGGLGNVPLVGMTNRQERLRRLSRRRCARLFGHV